MFPRARAASLQGGWSVVVFVLVVLTALLLAPDVFAAVRRAPALELPAVDLPELPIARDGAAVVAGEGALYVVGGESREGLLGRLERFDLTTRRWQVLSDELIPRRHASVVLVGDQLLVFGGRGERGPEAVVEAWHLGRGVLETRAPMPTPRYFAGAALFEGQVYVAGGTMGWGRTDVVEVYDPARDEWYVNAPLKEARDTQLVVVGGVLYALGGYTGEGVSTLIERFDGRRFVEAGRMPKPTSAFAAAVVGDEVYLFGDHRDIGRVLRLRPETGAFRELRTGYFPRRLSAAAAVGETIFVVGGSQPSGHKLGAVERFDID